MMPEEMQGCLTLGSVAELFEILDVDNSGLVTEEEFIEGIMNFCIFAAPVETIQMLKLIKMMRVEICQVSTDLVSLRSELLRAAATDSAWRNRLRSGVMG